MRKCTGCQEMQNKKELIRVVRNDEGEFSLDTTGKKPGRGAYICDNIECLNKVIKSKRLEKALDTKISEEVYENLRGVIIDK